MEVVILAAGRGERLGYGGRPHISHTPKPLLSLGVETLIERQVRLLIELGVSNIKIVAGDNKIDIQQKLGDSVEYMETNTNHHNALYELADVCRITKEKEVMLVLLGDTVFSKGALEEMITTDKFGIIVYGSYDTRTWWSRTGEIFAIKLIGGYIQTSHLLFKAMPETYYELHNIPKQLNLPVHPILECCDIDFKSDYSHALEVIRKLDSKTRLKIHVFRKPHQRLKIIWNKR